MYLICYGTRPELIKLIPLIQGFKQKNIEYKTLFSGQHKDLIQLFENYIEPPSFKLDVFEKKQSLNELCSKVIKQVEKILQESEYTVIVQGDTSTSLSIALAAFNTKQKVIHLEAGLRTYNKYSPYPEEMNRCMISQIANVHLCPTKQSVKNLKREGIEKNVHLVGNTIVDMFHSTAIEPPTYSDYILVTLHRRENRGDRMKQIWRQLNQLSEKYLFVYLIHPSLPESETYLSDRIIKLPPQNYSNMMSLISGSDGIITDSGGIQEEAVCAQKRVLICRDTTERPETIECGYGMLANDSIVDHMDFLYTKDNIIEQDNPYGMNVVEKIIKVIEACV